MSHISSILDLDLNPLQEQPHSPLTSSLIPVSYILKELKKFILLRLHKENNDTACSRLSEKTISLCIEAHGNIEPILYYNDDNKPDLSNIQKQLTILDNINSIFDNYSKSINLDLDAKLNFMKTIIGDEDSNYGLLTNYLNSSVYSCAPAGLSMIAAPWKPTPGTHISNEPGLKYQPTTIQEIIKIWGLFNTTTSVNKLRNNLKTAKNILRDINNSIIAGDKVESLYTSTKNPLYLSILLKPESPDLGFDFFPDSRQIETNLISPDLYGIHLLHPPINNIYKFSVQSDMNSNNIIISNSNFYTQLIACINTKYSDTTTNDNNNFKNGLAKFILGKFIKPKPTANASDIILLFLLLDIPFNIIDTSCKILEKITIDEVSNESSIIALPHETRHLFERLPTSNDTYVDTWWQQITNIIINLQIFKKSYKLPPQAASFHPYINTQQMQHINPTILTHPLHVIKLLFNPYLKILILFGIGICLVLSLNPKNFNFKNGGKHTKKGKRRISVNKKNKRKYTRGQTGGDNDILSLFKPGNQSQVNKLNQPIKLIQLLDPNSIIIYGVCIQMNKKFIVCIIEINGELYEVKLGVKT